MQKNSPWGVVSDDSPLNIRPVDTDEELRKLLTPKESEGFDPMRGQLVVDGQTKWEFLWDTSYRAHFASGRCMYAKSDQSYRGWQGSDPKDTRAASVAAFILGVRARLSWIRNEAG